jgi:hypothetical protein
MYSVSCKWKQYGKTRIEGDIGECTTTFEAFEKKAALETKLVDFRNVLCRRCG